MVNIVLHAILFESFEYEGVYIRPSEMLLSNRGRMTSSAMIEIQIPKTYIYLTPLSRFINDNCGFWPDNVFYLLMKNLYIYNLYVKNGI